MFQKKFKPLIVRNSNNIQIKENKINLTQLNILFTGSSSYCPICKQKINLMSDNLHICQICDECGQSFSRKLDLERHYKAMHLKTGKCYLNFTFIYYFIRSQLTNIQQSSILKNESYSHFQIKI